MKCRLAINAFREVLQKRQSKYRKVIEWLDERIGFLKGREWETCEKMRRMVRTASS